MSLSDVRRYLRDALTDFRLFASGKADAELPPIRLRRVGAGDFREMGRWVRDFLVENGLRREDRVLDIGCGVGRVAIALKEYLAPAATYDGFDAVSKIVRWCRRNITRTHPNFRFTHAKVDASHYARGAPASSFRFPYPEASFDFAFATSVFTHMTPDETANYVRESHRVLAPGGRLVATFFLAYGDERAPGGGFAFPAGDLPALFPPASWAIEVRRGSWRETGSFSIKGQDVVSAVKSEIEN